MASVTAGEAAPAREQDIAPESEQRVTPLELFFDLVFVIAITPGHAVHGRRPDAKRAGARRARPGRDLVGMGRLRLADQRHQPKEGVARLVVFLAMAAMLVVVLAIPGAFGEDALLFAIAYAVVRAAQIVLYGSALVALAATAAVVTPIAYEAIRFSASRVEIRHQGMSTPPR